MSCDRMATISGNEKKRKIFWKKLMNTEKLLRAIKKKGDQEFAITHRKQSAATVLYKAKKLSIVVYAISLGQLFLLFTII